ncbi:tRNA nuclease WapA precursor [Thalassoglobus neptunius]|uniref:tRNA nuclease WapA n=2 Tax=Thalassoglobus neptunius TaxID=1938619 RepID=A0A5C5UYM8_9PLAN|nr:tRNA nuclease WapA precursor [Thalassoglobus neptunius]
MAVAQIFTYDAYGQLLAIQNATGTLTSGGGVDNLADSSLALTTLLYSGEQFDNRIGQQYLRARYYNASTGRFNRLDPFFGNQSDPQSFHKYLYTHADPVNGIDPTGLEFSLVGKMVVSGVSSGLAATFVNAVAAKIYGQALSFRDHAYAFSTGFLTGAGAAGVIYGAPLALATGSVGWKLAWAFSSAAFTSYEGAVTALATGQLFKQQRYAEGSAVLGLGIFGRLSLLFGTRTALQADVMGDIVAPKAFNPASFAGKQAVHPPHLPAGKYPALVIDGEVYVGRMHITAWELAGKKGVEQFYGFAEIDAAGKVVSLFK